MKQKLKKLGTWKEIVEISQYNVSVKAYNMKRINQRRKHDKHKMHTIKLKQCQVIEQS